MNILGRGYKMQGVGKNPQMPWSRHFAPSPQLLPKEGAHGQDNNYQKRQAAWEARRKAGSESDLFNNKSIEMNGEEDSWDSQSDPGTESPNFRARFSSKFPLHGENKDKRHSNGASSSNQAGEIGRKPVQGRCNGPHRGLRMTTQGISGNENNSDCVVAIPTEVVPDHVAILNTQTPRYLHAYHDCLYFSCLAPHKWDAKEETEQTNCQYALHVIQKVSDSNFEFLTCFLSILSSRRFTINASCS